MSGYRFSVDGASPRLREAESPDLFHARFLADSEDRALKVRREVVMAAFLLETLTVHNLEAEDRRCPVELALAADFADLFEVRGVVPPRPREPRVAVEGSVLLVAYRGGDGVRRWTRVTSSPPPDEVEEGGMRWDLPVEAREVAALTVKVEYGTGTPPALGGAVPAAAVIAALEREWGERAAAWPRQETGDPWVDAWLRRASRDALGLPLSANGWRVPAAGLPWYVAPFGRDSLIFGLQTAHLAPEAGRDTLRFLAAHQGRRTDPGREEEPGKILHELRRGELAGEGRIPHTPYYGTVDATPLFLCLLEEVRRWTGDQALCRDLLPAARAAVRHLEAVMDRSPGGFLGYVGGPPPRLRHQGWRDGEHGVLRPDGTQPEPPVAVCEAQGYAYWALRRFAALARSLGDEDAAAGAEARARSLRRRFDRAFWMPAERTYALALEGEEARPVPSVTSNAGLLLLTGILTPVRAAAVCRRLLQEDMFSGWGVRTVSADSPLYDPLSYHNGSVWPHDNALVAWGMARSGHEEEAAHLYRGLRDAAEAFPHRRLPELFSGRARRASSPEPVPGSCPIQAWSSGVPFLLLRAFLGLEAEAAGILRIRPYLPPTLETVAIQSLALGRSRLDVRAVGEGKDVEVEIQAVEGPEVEVKVDRL